MRSSDNLIRRDHHRLDARSRALHAAVAAKLRRDPSLLSVPLENLARWERQGGSDSALQEWKEILRAGSLEQVLSLLEENSERADRLRQSSPFAGIFSPEERMQIMRAFDSPEA